VEGDAGKGTPAQSASATTVPLQEYIGKSRSTIGYGSATSADRSAVVRTGFDFITCIADSSHLSEAQIAIVEAVTE
jgi:hypothetical protein